VTAYAADRWTDFGVGVAGASAALAGLVFVAVSIGLVNAWVLLVEILR
jgi:hypothetical protein